jgi:hypothetical protein
MKNEAAYHAPLQPRDSETQTVGCRHTQPDICAKNGLPKVCALVRADKICYAPPRTWPKQFLKLKQQALKAKKKV